MQNTQADTQHLEQWSKEVQVDEFVRQRLKGLGLQFGSDFSEKDASPYLKDALKGASKTKKQSGTGVPDFVIETYELPILIECKLKRDNLESKDSNDLHSLHLNQKAISNYALNGALHYAQHIIKSKKYKEVIAIGIAGDNPNNIAIKTLYVYDETSYTELHNNDLNFLENKESFSQFYEDIILSEEQKHAFLLQKRATITKHAKNLNKLMNDNSISTHERALYVAACLLSQQDIKDKEGYILEQGLSPDSLQSVEQESYRDSVKIKNHIQKFLKQRDLTQEKIKLMINAFERIAINTLRDKPKKNHKLVEKLLPKESSVNKQVFTYIYENIYKEINILNKNSKFYDVMGELYNEFLKYAMNDGKMGIVLTPSYVTKMMSQILEINADSKVMDLATGSAGFLIAAMDLMIDLVRNNHHKTAKQKADKISQIKQNQLLGVEENTDMFALATTNMILRGDGSSKIIQNDSFLTALELKAFQADRILLNPPFSYKENGMPFIKLGLDNMPPHALGAIIIQDSAGSGKAKETNQAILKYHTLKASIKMPMDLFIPMAGVQTSIYIFEAKVPHDFDKPVKFIDFRNDGYKRTKKALQEVDNPIQRYIDILKIYKQGLNARIDNSVYKEPIKLEEVYVEDFIADSGADWNFDQHKKIDTTPTLQDFKQCVSEYLAWEVANVLKNQNAASTNGGVAKGGAEGNALSPRLEKLEKEFKQNGGAWRKVRIIDLFEVATKVKLHSKADIVDNGATPLYSSDSSNGGIVGYCNKTPTFKIDENNPCYVIFGDHTRAMNIVKTDFCITDNVKVLKPKYHTIDEYLLYIFTLWKKCIPNLGYARHWSIAKKVVISLPILPKAESNKSAPCHTDLERSEREVSNVESQKDFSPTAQNDKTDLESKDYQIAFDYMESYIKELEAERLEELEAYFKVTGLSDYTLTEKEKAALKAFESLSKETGAESALSALCAKELESGCAKKGIEWQSFKIGELFKVDTGTLLVSQDLKQGSIPRISVKSDNNGILGYFDTESNSEARHCENFISVNFFGDTFYHPYKASLEMKVHTLKLKKGILTKTSGLFIVGIIKKVFYGKFTYGNQLSSSKLKNENFFISLPVLPQAESATIESSEAHKHNLESVVGVGDIQGGGLDSACSAANPHLQIQAPPPCKKKKTKNAATDLESQMDCHDSANAESRNDRTTSQIDFSFIESFITAIQKECIKSVILWQEKQKAAYEKVVEKV